MRITLKSCLVIAVVSLIVFWTSHFASAQSFAPDRRCLTSITKPSSITDVANPKIRKDVEAFSYCYLGKAKGVQSPVGIDMYICQKKLFIEIGYANVVNDSGWMVMQKGIKEFLEKNYPRLKKSPDPRTGDLVYDYKIFYNRDLDRMNRT
jgi:hypothetical protein